MTRDEILENVKIEDVLKKAGVRTKNGRSQAICHDSGKNFTADIRNNYYYCHACNKSMNVIDVAMALYGYSFPEAFVFLGGTYEKPTMEQRMSTERKQTERQKRIEDLGKIQKKIYEASHMMKIYRTEYEKHLPFSDDFTNYYNLFMRWLGKYETLIAERNKINEHY